MPALSAKPLITPEARLRATYYLLFTLVGVFHAEVLSRSQPWVLVSPTMFAIVTPVYGVHYLVFGDLLLRKRIQGWVPVFLFGCLLGLYEFAITKVFWVPPWNPAAATGAGFAWFEVVWIGFAWHAFMSFLIPFLLMQTVFLPGTPKPWKVREVRWIMVGAPLYAAAIGVAFGAPGPEILVSILLSLGIIAAVSFLFARRAVAWGYRGPEDLVLGPRGRKVAIGSMAIVYLAFGLTVRADVVPASWAALAPLPFYAVVVALLWPHLRRAPAQAAGAPWVPAATAAEGAPAAPAWAQTASFVLRYAAAFAVILLIVYGAWLVAPPLVFVLVVVLMYGSALGALGLLAVCAREAWRVARAPAPPARPMETPAAAALGTQKE